MEQVAVVGVKIRVPGAETAETLWANMIAGTSSIAPLSAADLSNARIDESETQSPGYVARAGLIDGIEEFDHAFFDYSFREAQHIDPQQRLLLTLSHQLLETICPQTRSVGVFVSIGFPSYLIRNLVPARADATLSSMGNSSHGAATRIAYKLNLAGPAMTVECGCSSSLVALHMARLAILTGQCEMAMVGGCSLRIPAKQGYVHQRDGVLSEDGVCRPLDERATGTIFTSGVVVVAVKKLSAAVEDGDDIWCVVRSTAVNNDGNAKAGFTAPSVNGQRSLIQRAYARAGVSPRSIGYLEAHGTGTALGDPIEVQALTEAFAAFTPDCGYCSLGSIKANIGHLDVAAGLIGVVKAGLCLRKREMPPLANFSRINPKINLAASPFYIQTEPRHWDVHDAEPRRAAVNSLGVGGTNAHALLEEAPPWRPGLSSRWGLIFASAKGPAELEAKATAITAAARAAPEQVGDLAYTAQLCPPHHATRGAYFVDARAPTGVDSKAFRPTGDWRERGIVFAFSGQGTQYEGMGRELYEHVAAFRTAFDQAASLFRSAHAEGPLALLGADLAAISRAEALQPYLFSLEYALGRVLLDLGVQPTLLLGHSLGEYVAATFAGVFDLETAVRVVAERSRLMALAPRGAMLVVQAPEHVAQRYTGENISLCVVNGARSSVLGGTVEAIDILARELEQSGEKVIRLNTSHAFHSHLMAGAAAEFERAFDGVALRAPQIPIVSNLDGRKDDPLRFTSPQYWVRHLREPVRFIDGLRAIAAATPPPVLLELGPGRAASTHLLSSFPLSDVAVLASLAPGHEREHFFGAIGQLWLNGVALNLGALYRERRGRITPLPPSQLVSRRCWVDPPEATTLATPVAAASSVPGKQEKISDWFYEQRWLPRTRSDENPPPDETRRELTVFSTSQAAGKELCRALELAGAVVRLIDIQDVCQARQADDVADLERSILERLGGRKADRAIVFFAGGDGTSSNADAVHAVLVAIAIAKIVRSTRREGAEFIVIGTHGVRTTTEPLHWWNGWMDGFTTVANQEVSGLSVRYVDLEEGILAESEPGPRALLAHTILHGSDRVCALRGGLVWERELRAVRLGSKRGAGSLLQRVLIVGGTGNVGLTYALHFLRAGASGIAIVSRSAEDIEPRLAAGDVPDRQIWARRRRLIEEAKRAGVDLCFLNANADSPDEVDRAAQEAAQRFAGLDAIVHASGAPAELHFRAFLETDRAHLETLYRAKLEVAQSLDRAARRLHVPRVLAVSSISGTLGGLGLLGYATSHNLLDAYAASSSDALCRWTSIAWDAWDFYKEDRSADARDVGIDALAISEQEGLEALGAVQGAAWPERIIISSGDLHRRHAAWVLRAGSEQRRLELGERPNLREEYAAPKGTTDRRLVELVGDTIGLKTVGIRDNFFDLGCDSLIALTLVDQINKTLGSDISAIEIFKHPTVEKLAAWLDRASAEANAVAVASPPQAADAPAVDGGRANERRNYFAAMRNRRELAS